jgi:hypothetical protein
LVWGTCESCARAKLNNKKAVAFHQSYSFVMQLVVDEQEVRGWACPIVIYVTASSGVKDDIPYNLEKDLISKLAWYREEPTLTPQSIVKHFDGYVDCWLEAEF